MQRTKRFRPTLAFVPKGQLARMWAISCPPSVVEIYFHWAGTDADSIISTLIVGSQLSVGDKEI